MEAEEPVPVVFRRWRDTGTVLALFPTLIEGPRGECQSYEHIGQHGYADYSHCIRETIPAHLTEPDVQALKRELEAAPYGYRLRPVSRRPAPKPPPIGSATKDNISRNPTPVGRSEISLRHGNDKRLRPWY